MGFFCQSESFIEDVLRRESDLLLGSSMGEQHRGVGHCMGADPNGDRDDERPAMIELEPEFDMWTIGDCNGLPRAPNPGLLTLHAGQASGQRARVVGAHAAWRQDPGPSGLRPLPLRRVHPTVVAANDCVEILSLNPLT